MSDMTYLDKILRLFTSEFTDILNTSCAVFDHQKVYIYYENLQCPTCLTLEMVKSVT